MRVPRERPEVADDGATLDADTAPGLVRRELRGMNTDISLVCEERHAGRLDRAAIWLAAFERRFSRFLPDSELSRLNRSCGAPFRATPGLFRLVALALEFAARSGGLFDPTVLRELEAAGYDRSFELITEARSVVGPAPRRASWRDVRLDPRARTITLPAGVGVDLGGIGKGWAVDRVACVLGTPCLVNCGGDVYAGGYPRDDTGWHVGVSDPFEPECDLMLITVQDRAVATSSSMRRRWSAGERYMHHLIDPRTGAPSASDAVQVTVVAPSARLADYHAKVALLLGAASGLQYLTGESGVEGLVVRSDGSVLETERFGMCRRD